MTVGSPGVVEPEKWERNIQQSSCEPISHHEFSIDTQTEYKTLGTGSSALHAAVSAMTDIGGRGLHCRASTKRPIRKQCAMWPVSSENMQHQHQYYVGSTEFHLRKPV